MYIICIVRVYYCSIIEEKVWKMRFLVPLCQNAQKHRKLKYGHDKSNRAH